MSRWIQKISEVRILKRFIANMTSERSRFYKVAFLIIANESRILNEKDCFQQ